MKKLTISLLACTALLTGCPDSKKTEAGPEAAPEAEGATGDEAKPAAEGEEKGDEAGAAAEAEGLKLEKLDLTIDLPADSTVMDMLGTLMITGGGTVVSVAEVKADGLDPKTFEEAKEAKGDYSPTKVGKEEKTEDGWLITFENEGGAGTNYWVWSRRTIDGKTYKCETTASSSDQQAKAVTACASLKK